MNATIGINANHADSSAVLFIDNQLIFGIEEERLNRVKHWAGFPENSIRECLKIIDKYNISEVDVAINSNIFFKY
jgi:carbamoyltransferase